MILNMRVTLIKAIKHGWTLRIKQATHISTQPAMKHGMDFPVKPLLVFLAGKLYNVVINTPAIQELNFRKKIWSGLKTRMKLIHIQMEQRPEHWMKFMKRLKMTG